MDELWLKLFRHALKIIDSSKNVNAPTLEWTLGGETVLYRKFGHRYSKDVDIFMNDVQYVTFFSPRLNNVAEGLIENRGSYVEQSNFVKLILDEPGCAGDIDFVVSSRLTHPAVVSEEIDGRIVLVETPEEILAKKVFYRADGFTARDVFDLSFLIDQGHEFMLADKKMYAPKLKIIINRLTQFSNVFEQEFLKTNAILYKPSFQKALSTITEFFQKFGCDDSFKITRPKG